jgi:Uma2 family endonuclease
MATQTLLTAEEFLALPNPDDRLYDLDEGELIEMTRPGMPHGIITGKIIRRLVEAVVDPKLGAVMGGEVAFVLTDGTVRAPDVAVLLGERGVKRPGAIEGPPDIAIEVLSPNDIANHVARKRKQLLDAGAKEVWLFEPEIEMVEVYYSDGTWRGFESPATLTTPLIPDLRLNLTEIFA